MSIYATLWKLRFPKDGDHHSGCEWIEVTAQGVPPQIGSPTPGAGHEQDDLFAGFLPPPIALDSDGEAPQMRAVVVVTEFTPKGTDRSPQEYQSPLLVLSGEDYSRMTFADLYEKICIALRGNRTAIVAEILRPDGSSSIIRQPRNPP